LFGVILIKSDTMKMKGERAQSFRVLERAKPSLRVAKARVGEQGRRKGRQRVGEDRGGGGRG